MPLEKKNIQKKPENRSLQIHENPYHVESLYT